MDPAVAERLERFKGDLPRLEAHDMVGKYVTAGECYALNVDQHFELRRVVAAEFQVHTNEIVVVGSGKLGFSIAEHKRFRPFYDQSDIDIAVVSDELFDRFWQDVFAFERAGGYWERSEKFKRYLFRGWMRPDLLPNDFERSSRWWEFFRGLTNSGDYGEYPLKAGLYKSWFFLDAYHRESIEKCRAASEGDL